MLLTVSEEEIAQARQDTALKIELDWQSYMSEARKEGRTEGEAKGLAQGLAEGEAKGLAKGEAKARKEREKARREKLESARRLKALGIPPDKITAGLELSPEDIEAL
jgi:predicted transposase YdaD